MKRSILTLLLVGPILVIALGCSDDEDTGGSGTSPAAACDTMCKGAGFTSSRVDAQANETNCFCTGTGTVTAAACTEMCKSVSKPGAPFRSGAGTGDNACQCQ